MLFYFYKFSFKLLCNKLILQQSYVWEEFTSRKDSAPSISHKLIGPPFIIPHKKQDQSFLNVFVATLSHAVPASERTAQLMRMNTKCINSMLSCWIILFLLSFLRLIWLELTFVLFIGPLALFIDHRQVLFHAKKENY